VTQSALKCPYCQFDIPSAATVCGYCTKELSTVKPFMSRMDQLDAEVAQLKTELADLRTLVQTKSTKVRLINADSEFRQDLPDLESPVQKLSGTKAIYALVLSLLMCAGLLDLLHWILLFIYDTNLLVLRVITVVIPMVVGLIVFRKIRTHWLMSLLSALSLGVLSVYGMLAITNAIDGVPLLPESNREWREVAEYCFAISCAFMTGLLIENWRVANQINFRKNISLSLLIQRDEKGKFKAPEWTEQIESIFTAVAPFISAGTAIVSGVKVFIG
jgi:hypothetical protein